MTTSDYSASLLLREWRDKLLRLKEHIKPREIAVASALEKAELLQFDKMTRLVRPNSDVQNAHLQLCDTPAQAHRILIQYQNLGVKRTTTTFNILLSLSPDLSAANSCLIQMAKYKLKHAMGCSP